MKIEDKTEKQLVKLEDIERGDAFKYRGKIFIKTIIMYKNGIKKDYLRESDFLYEIECVNVSDKGTVERLSSQLLVSPAKAKIVIED